LVLTAGTGTVDMTVTTAAGTSPVDTAKDSFTCDSNLVLLAGDRVRKQHLPQPVGFDALDGRVQEVITAHGMAANVP
jgi:hypothetical protein